MMFGSLDERIFSSYLMFLPLGTPYYNLAEAAGNG
jgi:hypothetical protein